MDTQTKLKIEGMSCQMCVKHVTKALSGISGVTDVEVSLDEAQAVVRYDSDQAGMAAFKAAVDEAGYKVAD